MFAMGISTSTYMISIMSSLQMMVPDRMRGRVMGFYGMTWSIMPLGGMQAGAMASAVGVRSRLRSAAWPCPRSPGPALVNGRVRNIGSLLLRTEQSIAASGPGYRTSATSDD